MEVPARPRVTTADLGPGVLAGFTTRHDGVSTGPWASLDLGLHVGDDPRTVAANRAAVAGWAGAPVVYGRQVHSARVRVVTADDLADADPLRQDLDDPIDGCDSLVTVDSALALGVLVADCVPVLLADSRTPVIGVAHAGRVGLLAGVVQHTLVEMTRLGAQPGNIRAALGPAAGGCCYEVPQDLQDDACASLSSMRTRTSWGTPSLDLRAGVRQILAAAGVASIELVGGCSIEDDDVFSHRRATRAGTTTGRCAGVVRLLR